VNKILPLTVVVKLKNSQNFSMTSNSRENMKGGVLVNIKVGNSRRQVAATLCGDTLLRRRCDKLLRAFSEIFVKIFIAAKEFCRRN